MIFNALINGFVGTLNAIFWVLSFGGNTVDLSNIPYIGSAFRDILITALSYWNTALTVVPYLVLPWHIFIYVLLPFEILMLVAKVILGSRVPTMSSE